MGLLTDYSYTDMFYKYEFGLHYYGLTFSYGYLFTVNRNEYFANGHMFSIKYKFMLYYMYDFYKRLYIL